MWCGSDPQEVYGGECTMCGRWVADNEDMTDELCDDCWMETEDDEPEDT